MTHLNAKKGEEYVQNGVDIKNYTESDEWDILSVTAKLSPEPKESLRDSFYSGLLKTIKHSSNQI